MILSSVPLDRLKDEWQNKLPGDPFLTDPYNESLLKPMFTDIIANFEAEIEDGYVLVARTEEFGSTADLATPTVKKSFIEKAAWLYEDAANRFLELLLIAILVTGQSPLIGDDLLNTRIRDEVEIERGLTIVNWRVINSPNCLRCSTSVGGIQNPARRSRTDGTAIRRRCASAALQSSHRKVRVQGKHLSLRPRQRLLVQGEV